METTRCKRRVSLQRAGTRFLLYRITRLDIFRFVVLFVLSCVRPCVVRLWFVHLFILTSNRFILFYLIFFSISTEGVTRWRSLMWPNVGGDWLIYATLNSSQCHQLDFIEYLADRSRASSIRHAVVRCTNNNIPWLSM